MSQPIIEFRDVSFRYDSQAVPTLQDINVAIYPGEKVLVLGPSGSGKSTFGKILNGLIPHAFAGELSGQVIIDGQDVSEHSILSLSYQVGTVLQDTSAQFVGMSVAEDIAFALENDEIAVDEMHVQVDEWVKRLNLQQLVKESPHALSGGQKQRVSMAGVLIDQPPILLFDEPLASLDPATGYATMALIDRIHEEHQTTMVIIEHRLEDVLSHAVDRVLVFDQGRIVYNGKPSTLLQGDLLGKVGIREPLYVSAIRYARGELATVQHIESLAQVSAEGLAEQVHHWLSQQVIAEPVRQQTPLLTVKDVTFQYPYKDKLTIQPLNLTLYQGEMVSLVGTNGAGKTTLAKLLTNFEKCDSGQLLWRGEDITGDSIAERATKIGYVMQDPNQMISQQMIFDEIAFGLRQRGLSEATVMEKVHQVMKICGLYPFREWPMSALSYGQKKRVTIAAILVLEPELLILDEPTAGQDYRHYHEFMEFVKALNRQGVTVMMITHDLHLMLDYSDRTLVLVSGELVADQSPFAVLTSQALTEQASLRPTTLYTFAQKMRIADTTQFVQQFMRYDRQVLDNA